MSFPPAVSDFKALFTREFIYGQGPNTVMDADIQRALNEIRMVFNPTLFPDDQANYAYLHGAAHFMVLNIQAAGGLSATNQGRGIHSKGGGTIESKGAGSVNVAFAVPDFVRQSPILSQFMRTDFGQKYIQLLTPRLVGNVQVVAGEFGQDFGLAGKPLPLAITTLTLPGGTHAVAYSQTLHATGGVSPLTWTVSTGTLPTGLSLGSFSGTISGTPTTPGTSFFVVTVTDGQTNTAIMNYQLVIS